MGFREEMQQYGKQVTVSFLVGDTSYQSSQIVTCNPNFETTILSACMKSLDLELDGVYNVPEGSRIKNLRIGVKAPESLEYTYRDYGTYIVQEQKRREDTSSLTLTCYDLMLEAMVPYDLQLDYSSGVTVKNLLDAICNRFGWNTGYPESFVNSSVLIDEEKFDETYTFRSVLEEIAQVSASIIVFDDDDTLLMKYIEDEVSGGVVTPDNLKTITLGKKFGPVNSIILSRAPQEDNIYKKDDGEVTGEIRIENNQIMDTHREDFIDAIYEKLKGLTYYAVDIESFGMGDFEVGQRFEVEMLDGERYSSLALINDFTVGQSVNETLTAKQPDTATTDYMAADTTDQRINRAILRVDKQDLEISSLVTKTQENANSLSTLEVSISQMPDSLTSRALSEMVQSDEWETIVQNISEVRQTAHGLEIEVSGTTKNVTELAESFYKLFQVKSDGLHIQGGYLGDDGDYQQGSFETVLNDTKLSFMQDRTEVAYIQHNRLNINEAWVVNGVAIGDPGEEDPDTGELVRSGEYVRMHVDKRDTWCLQIMGGE